MKYAAVMFFATIVAQVVADTPGRLFRRGPHAAQLKVSPRMDGRGADLRGTKMVDLNLRGAIFDECDLYGVYIEDCDLTGASFKNAHFRGSKIGGCKIEGADFTGAFINGLGDVEHSDAIRLSTAQLTSTKSFTSKNLVDCIVHGDESSPPKFDFRDFQLRGARLSGDLTKCNFYNVRFAQVRVTARIHFDQFKEPAGLERVCFANSDLYGATILGKVSFAGADIRGAVIKFGGPSAFAQDIDYTDAKISGCSIHMTQAQLHSTKSFKTGYLRGIRLQNVGLEGFDFRRQDLSESNFRGCQLEGARFDDAVISLANFSLQDISVDQIKSTWNFKNDRMATVTLSKSLREELKKAAKD